jgi:hypothetical protein
VRSDLEIPLACTTKQNSSIWSQSSDQNAPLSFQCFENPLFSMSSSHDPVIRMFHCLFIVLKISLFSMPSSHDPVIRMFRCLFIVLKIPAVLHAIQS